MGYTIIGVFSESGDADLAAAHLREEFALDAGELEMIGQTEWDNLRGAAEGDSDGDPIGKRWGDRVAQGDTLVVARTGDPDVAEAVVQEMHQLGAVYVDLLSQ